MRLSFWPQWMQRDGWRDTSNGHETKRNGQLSGCQTRGPDLKKRENWPKQSRFWKLQNYKGKQNRLSATSVGNALGFQLSSTQGEKGSEELTCLQTVSIKKSLLIRRCSPECLVPGNSYRNVQEKKKAFLHLYLVKRGPWWTFKSDFPQITKVKASSERVQGLKRTRAKRKSPLCRFDS